MDRERKATPLDLVRQGRCPHCKGPGDVYADGSTGFAKDYAPKCCCRPCWIEHGDRKTPDESWDMQICEICPRRGTGPHG